MKKFKLVGTLLCIFAFVGTANAAEVTDEEYALLRKVFSEPRIALMSDEEAQTYLSYDLENTVSSAKYYMMVEDNNTVTNYEITEEEYENADPDITLFGASVNTSYKSLQIYSSHMGGSSYLITLTTEWKATPRVKSFDVSAVRVLDGYVPDGSQFGTQTYWTYSDGQYHDISYSPYGTNISKKSNGYGISMNLVDNASYFGLDIQSTVTCTSPYCEVYGSYQHATSNVTLAQSQNYTLSQNGLGHVINFASSVIDKYDGMAGVNLPLTYYG